jgi:hypothetical protein
MTIDAGCPGRDRRHRIARRHGLGVHGNSEVELNRSAGPGLAGCVEDAFAFGDIYSPAMSATYGLAVERKY